jgi:hypothetical protein
VVNIMFGDYGRNCFNGLGPSLLQQAFEIPVRHAYVVRDLAELKSTFSYLSIRVRDINQMCHFEISILVTTKFTL